VLDHKPAIELVIGVRLPLLGHAIERQPLRRMLGRLFAQAASLVLGIGICDTQCGAKLFRATPALRQAFEQPFLARWTFDVELLARLRNSRPGQSPAGLEQAIYEFPLDRWRDVAGSKVKASDFFKSLFELLHIYWAYLRPGAGTAAQDASRSTAVDEHDRNNQQRAA